MIQEATQLIKQLTEVASEAKIYLARLNGSEFPLTPTQSQAKVVLTEATVGPAPTKPKKNRKKKTAAPVSATPIAEMTEEESAKEVLVVARAFVKCFVEAQPSGLQQAEGILKSEFKLVKIADLVHAQRLKFMNILTTKIAEANKES